MEQLDYPRTISAKIGILQTQRDQSFAAYQQNEQIMIELKNRILGLDGALKVLRELEAASKSEKAVETLEP